MNRTTWRVSVRGYIWTAASRPTVSEVLGKLEVRFFQTGTGLEVTIYPGKHAVVFEEHE